MDDFHSFGKLFISILVFRYKFNNSAELVIENVINNTDVDKSVGDAEHHRFWIWHKIILFFIITSEFFAFISIIIGVYAFCFSVCAFCFRKCALSSREYASDFRSCAPCFRRTLFAFTSSLFIALLCSLIADGVFYLAANRVDNRFVQGMVGIYEQQIGYAFYVHLMGALAWLFAFLCTMATTYKFITRSQAFDDNTPFGHRDPLRGKHPVYRQPRVP